MNENSRQRTNTPWQRCAPHAPTPSQANDFWRSLQTVTHITGERQGVTDPEDVPVTTPKLWHSWILTWLQVVL